MASINQNPQGGNKAPNPTPQGNQGNRPDVRDDLDSRSNEEQEFKGDDVTHKKKETKEEKLKDKND